MNWLALLRYLHVMAAAAWLGEVVVINFVLVPALADEASQTREGLVCDVFPRLFRLASILSITTVVTGAGLAYVMSGGRLEPFLTTSWGRAVAAGGTLGLLVTLFHLFMEPRLERIIAWGREDAAAMEVARARLRVVPRIGLGVLLVSFVLMMYAVRSP